VQAYPQKSWFGKNPGKISENPGKFKESLGKICANLHKIPENLGKLPKNTSKTGAQRAFIWENGPQNNMKTLFFCGHSKFGPHAMHSRWPKIFSGKFGEIWAKILRTPKIWVLLHLCVRQNMGEIVHIISTEMWPIRCTNASFYALSGPALASARPDLTQHFCRAPLSGVCRNFWGEASNLMIKIGGVKEWDPKKRRQAREVWRHLTVSPLQQRLQWITP